MTDTANPGFAQTVAGQYADLRRVVPEIAEGAGAAHALLSSFVDPVTVELCRLRISQIVGGADQPAVASTAAQVGVTERQLRELPSFRSSDQFDDTQKACLEFAEYYCYS